MFTYPWGDFHSLNLGWFLLQFKDWVEKIQEYLDNGGGTSENLANVIAPVFNAENSYLTGDYALYNDELYKANQAVNPGTWDPNAWTRCLVTEEMGSGTGGVDNVARLMIAGQYSNTYNYQKYAICRYNDKLWMCNTNLPAGGEEWEPSHWDEITVGAGLTGLRRSAETLSNAITDLQNIVGDGTLSGFTATNLTGAVNELMGSLNSVQGQITANIETNATASKAYAVGEYLVLNGTLYRVIAAIANGATITPNTNVAATTIGNEVDIKTYTATDVYTQSITVELFKSGHFAEINSVVTSSTGTELPSGWQTLFTIPVDIRPSLQLRMPIINYSDGNIYQGRVIPANGNVQVYLASATAFLPSFTFVYLL